MANFYRVIVREPDGLERLVLAREDQVITESEVLWDERIEKTEPPRDLLDKANLEDGKRDQARKDIEDAKQIGESEALQRLRASVNSDTQDLLIVLGLA